MLGLVHMTCGTAVLYFYNFTNMGVSCLLQMQHKGWDTLELLESPNNLLSHISVCQQGVWCSIGETDQGRSRPKYGVGRGPVGNGGAGS